MLKIVIDGTENFNNNTQTFHQLDDIVIELEHSLVSVAKWESIYQKAFLSDNKKTSDEIFEYFKNMIVRCNADLDVLDKCSQENFNKIQEYIDSNQSATTFGSMPERRGPGEIITSELIYYWMIAFNVPFECQFWHLNRLFSLIRICNIKNSKPKKMSRTEIAQRNSELNAKRKAELGTKG